MKLLLTKDLKVIPAKNVRSFELTPTTFRSGYVHWMGEIPLKQFKYLGIEFNMTKNSRYLIFEDNVYWKKGKYWYYHLVRNGLACDSPETNVVCFYFHEYQLHWNLKTGEKNWKLQPRRNIPEDEVENKDALEKRAAEMLKTIDDRLDKAQQHFAKLHAIVAYRMKD